MIEFSYGYNCNRNLPKLCIITFPDHVFKQNR